MAYLSSYIPEPNTAQRSVKTSWAGLNRKQTQDTGELSKAWNVSVKELPFLSSTKSDRPFWSAQPHDQITYWPNIISIHDVGDGAIVVFVQHEDDERVSAVYYGTVDEGLGGHGNLRWIGELQDYDTTKKRSVAAFNVYNGDNIVSAGFDRRILIFPDAYSFDPDATGTDAGLKPLGYGVPRLENVTVLNGRVFGVLDGKFYASKWNNYAGWDLPTVDTPQEDIPGMAWVSTTQSDIDASGEFTGITVYNGQVIGFKRNFMHVIYNNKNPFRIVDVAKVGAISQAAICEVNQTLYFIADDGVYAFSGGYPRRISDKLNIAQGGWEGSILCGDDRTLYCFVSDYTVMYTYDTVNGAWGVFSCDVTSNNMASVDGTCLYGFDEDVYKIGGGRAYGFDFETDASFGGALTEKKIKRLRLQVSHKEHYAGDYITVSVLRSNGSVAASKTLSPAGPCDTVISMLTRMTCDFGQKIRVEGTGDWVIKYLQTDYEPGGEKYV